MKTSRFRALRRDSNAAARRSNLDRKKGALIYCRVSTEDQLENFSIGTQERDCRAWCGREGLEVVQIFTEAASAKTADRRPEFQAMLRYCKKNRNNIAAVVVWAINRFSRNQRDFLNVCEELRQIDIRLLSVTEKFDSETPEGRLQQSMVSMFAQFDNEKRSERTKIGMRVAMESGKWCHKPPLGFVTDPSVAGGLRRDPDRAHLIRQAFELYASGCYTKAAVSDIVTNLGLTQRESGKAVSAQTFDKVLRNPIYAGWIVSERWDLLERGKFEPIIDTELFERVQEQLQPTTGALAERRSQHKEDFPLRVFVRCHGCGKGLTGSFATGRKGCRYPYYFCRSKGCRAVKFTRDVLHQQFIRMLYSLGPESQYAGLFREIVRRVWSQKGTEREQLRAHSQRRLSDLENRKRKLLDALLDGRIPQTVYEDEMRSVGTALNEALEAGDNVLPNSQQLEHLLEFAEWVLDRLAGLWNAAPLTLKHRLQSALFPDGITVAQEGFGTGLRPIFCSAFQPIPIEETSLASPRGFEPLLSP